MLYSFAIKMIKVPPYPLIQYLWFHLSMNWRGTPVTSTFVCCSRTSSADTSCLTFVHYFAVYIAFPPYLLFSYPWRKLKCDPHRFRCQTVSHVVLGPACPLSIMESCGKATHTLTLPATCKLNALHWLLLGWAGHT